MKKLFTIFFYILLFFCLMSWLYYFYSINLFGFKESAVKNEKSTLVTDYTVNDISDIVKIKNYVNNQDHQGLNRLGSVAIPEMGILLPIYNSPYDKNALKEGAQQLKPIVNNRAVDSVLGQGKVLLVAHNYNDGKTMFSPLQQYINRDDPYLVSGETEENHWLDGKSIYLATGNKIYEYKVDNQKVIRENQVSIRNEEEKKEIDVITCLFPSDSYRIVTHGKYYKKWSWESAPNNVINYFDTRKQKYNMKGNN